MTDLLPPVIRSWQRPARWLRTVVVVAVAGSGVALAGREIAQGEEFRVHELRFVGNDRASTAELRHLCDIRDGEHLFTADLDTAVKQVERHPWVADASARRIFPGVVEISVVEHEPALLLALDQLWTVDADGTPFRPAFSDDLDHPVITGLDPKLVETDPDLSRAIVWGALRVFHAWQGWRDGPPPPGTELSEIHWSPTLGYEAVLLSGSRLVLGMQDPAPLLLRLDKMVSAGLDLNVPTRVDLDIDTIAVASPLPPVGAARTLPDPTSPSPTSPLSLPLPEASGQLLPEDGHHD